MSNLHRLLVLNILSAYIALYRVNCGATIPVPFSVSASPECHIRAQVCQGITDNWDVGFIEVNNDRIHTWKCPRENNLYASEGYYFASVGAACKDAIFKGRFPVSTTETNFDLKLFMNSVYDLLHDTPVGGYAIIVSTGRYQKLRELYFNLNDTIYSGVFGDLGLVWLSNATGYFYLDSPGDNLNRPSNAVNNVVPWLNIDDDENALAIIARKFYPSQSVAKLIGKGHGPRTIDVQVDYSDWCIQALTPIDSVMLDPKTYGISDTVPDTISAKMHIDYGNRIGCSGKVYAFEYIPANTGSIYAGIFRYSGTNEQIFLLGSRWINIQNGTTDFVPEYSCFRNNPIMSVQPGDIYGYYTDNNAASIEPLIKVVYTMEFVNSKYPCSRQFTWGEASKIITVNRDSTNSLTTPFALNSAINVIFEGAMALRPIFDPEFVNTCECSKDTECTVYGDYNMECVSSSCQCRTDYVYSRKLNRCVNTVVAFNKTATQSSTLNSELDNEAGSAVDDDTSADVLTGTCSKTQLGANPWWVVDLGDNLNVQAVELKSIIPLDVYVELWINKPGSPGIPPDQILVRDYYNITLEFSIFQVQQLRVNGPYPWLIKAGNINDKAVLNRNFQDGRTVYTFDGPTGSSLGSVGQQVAIVSRIVNFGYIQEVGSNNCWELKSGADTVIKQTIVSGSKCNGIVVYIEEADNSPGLYVIRKLSDDQALTISTLVVNSQPAFVADRTTLQFNLANFISNTGDIIRPSNAVSFCLSYDGSDNLILATTNCKTFYLRKIFDDTIPVYSYRRVSFNSTVFGRAPFQYVDLGTASTQPCYEIADTPGVYAGIINYVNGPNGVNVVAVNGQPYDLSNIINSDILLRVNDVGVHDFTVGISTYFEPLTGFNPDNFTTCAYFFGAPINGRNFILECDKPIYGRYVAIYLSNGNTNEKLQLCDVKVHTLGGDVHQSICTTDADCQRYRDSGSGDQHLVCSSGGRCVCAIGFVYHKESKMCVDIDECQPPPSAVALSTNKEAEVCDLIPLIPTVGKTNGTCVNTIGAFYCSCPDGYEQTIFQKEDNRLVRAFCSDIVETTIQNCGCEQFCTNGRVDVENYKYYCSCEEGYRLSHNGHNCEDVDECLGGPEYINANCLDVVPISTISNIDLSQIRYCEMICATTLNCIAVQYNNVTRECLLTSSCSFIEYNLEYTTYSREDNEPRFFVVPDSECLETDELLSTGGNTLNCLTECLKRDSCIAAVIKTSSCVLKSTCSRDETSVPGTNLYYRKDRVAGKCRYLYDEAKQQNISGYPPSQCENHCCGYTCSCQPGYMYNSNKSLCLNINECPGLCEGQCTDTVPAESGTPYICDCGNLQGYKLGPDNYSCIDMNECIEGYNNCTYNSSLPPAAMYRIPPVQQVYQAFCHNIIASYYCECPPGFQWNPDDLWCEDIDECTSPLRIHECEDICINTNGSYICECHVGYKLSLNQHSCEDIDECIENLTACNFTTTYPPIHMDAMCQNTIGSYQCYCGKGYEFRNGTYGEGCYDINECETLKPCQDQCVNRYVYPDNITYECFCNDAGFKLSNDTGTCIDIDECMELINNDCTNDTNATCSNTIGSYHCNCPHGYIWNEMEKHCDDLNECNYRNGDCSHVCTNFIGFYICSCNTGFKLSNNNFTCEDVNECKDGTNSCTDKCTNNIGSYICECNPGRVLGTDQVTCSDINECATKNGGCEQTCTNDVVTLSNPAPPMFTCSCAAGYTLRSDGESCANINECQTNNGGCQQNCEDNIGSYKCTCRKGYNLKTDGKTCEDINECQTRNGMCEGSCSNNEGSYICSCAAGYTLRSDGHSCQDINECLGSKRDCSGEFSLCLNTPGSYQCICDRNYILGPDGKKCSGPNFVEVQSALNLNWDPRYADTTSKEYQNIKSWLDDYFGKLCIMLGITQISSCKVKGPLFPTVGTGSILSQPPAQPNTGPQNVVGSPANTNAKVGFNVDVVTDTALSAAQQGKISYDIFAMVQSDGGSVPVNNTQVGLSSGLEFVYSSPTGIQKTWTITSACDFFIQTQYCLNGAVCTLSNGNPVCKCTKGYSGSRCDESPMTKISDTDIGMIAGICGLGILILILTIAVVMIARKRHSENMPDILHREPLTCMNNPNVWRGPSYSDMFYNMYK